MPPPTLRWKSAASAPNARAERVTTPWIKHMHRPSRTSSPLWVAHAPPLQLVVLTGLLGIGGACAAQVAPGVADLAAAQPLPLEAAASAPLPETAGSRGQIEAGVGIAHLKGASGDWRDGYVRAMYRVAPETTVNAELASQGHFHQRGTLGALSVLHDLSPRWFVMGGISGGTADFQYRMRVDLGGYRKWGDERRWVTGVSLMKGLSGDHVHRDVMLRLTAAYYAPAGWIAEGGLALNHSQPGAVNAARGFGVFTWGTRGQDLWSLRVDHGREAYLPAGAGIPAGGSVSFSSTEVIPQWRHWLGKDHGFVAALQYYRNPYYRRTGASVGLFFDF